MPLPHIDVHYCCERFWPRGRQHGSATVEYVVVGLFLVTALLAGPDVIHVVWAAVQKAYTAFYYAISAAL